MSDSKYSPFNCYLGKFLDAFEILDKLEEHHLVPDFDAWEVVVMVRAQTLEEAYDMVIEIANRDNKRYEGELGGVSVKWCFEGVTELDPVYQNPDFDTDFIYLEHDKINLEDHRKFVRSKEELCEAA